MRPALYGAALLISAGAVSGAVAGERYGEYGRRLYPSGYGYGGGYGFAGQAIGGDYIGAPLMRFPRPSELVPSAWGYGTYGVPTITGIRQAPTAAPTLTVINADESAPKRRGPRILSRDADGQWSNGASVTGSGHGGVRVISVTVPRR